MSSFLDLFRRRPTGLAKTDFITLEFNPDDPTQYRLVRHQAEEGDDRATSTVLTPASWEGSGDPL